MVAMMQNTVQNRLTMLTRSEDRTRSTVPELYEPYIASSTTNTSGVIMMNCGTADMICIKRAITRIATSP